MPSFFAVATLRRGLGHRQSKTNGTPWPEEPPSLGSFETSRSIKEQRKHVGRGHTPRTSGRGPALVAGNQQEKKRRSTLPCSINLTADPLHPAADLQAIPG